MAKRKGVHLHVHSAFSFQDGVSSVADLVSEAARLEMPALSLTDHNGLYGAVQLVKACDKLGVKPLIGSEITLTDGTHLTLICENETGYKNLSRLLTRAHLEHTRNEPAVKTDWLSLYADGLIVLTGCRLGRLVYLLRAQQNEAAKRWVQTLISLFGRGNLYIELQRLMRPGDKWINARLLELAETLNLPVVATQNVHYAVPELFPVHDILSCARLNINVGVPHPRRPINNRNALTDALEWQDIYADCPDAIENTLRVAERCVENPVPMGGALFPTFPIADDVTPQERLKQLILEGAKRRYKIINEPIRKRLAYEWKVICQLGFADYFLAVHDLVLFAKSKKIRHSGRGSAADSAVAYCLDLTLVDPIRRKLPFERFLSVERSQNPDIDLDFDASRREEVFAYVSERYGEEHTAMVCAFHTYRARSAIRAVGTALGVPERVVDYFAKHTPMFCHADAVERAFHSAPELRHCAIESDLVKNWLRLCAPLAGLPRHIGTHVGGILISRAPIAETSPIQMAAVGRRIVQFDKDDVESLGFIKLDLLSLGMLRAVELAQDQIRLQEPEFRVENIPFDDPSTFDMIRSGDTIGTFQIESPAQRNLHQQLNSETQSDIDISVALIRPGPIRGDMVTPFVNRRNGVEPVQYPHPDLEEILKHTYGVPVFQEQIIMIATKLAGFSPGEADQLRKTMTHNRSAAAMERLANLFVEKSIQKGYSPEIALKVFEWMSGFAGYGFCEAHAASFGDLAYKTAYMLRFYPAELYAALLSSQPMGYYPVNTLAAEARRRKVKLKRPDINLSGIECTVKEGAIQLGFCRVAGMPKSQMESIIENRPENGYTSLAEVMYRTALQRDSLESLIRCGAFDSLHPHRRELIWQVSRLANVISKENSLLEPQDFEELVKAPPQMQDFTAEQRFMDEWRVLGLTVDCHVMAFLRADLAKLGVLSSSQFHKKPNGAWAAVAGLVVCPHRPPTKSGRKVMFTSLEDEFGSVETVMFETVYSQYGHLMLHHPIVIAEGILTQKARAKSLIVKRVSILKESKKPPKNVINHTYG